MNGAMRINGLDFTRATSSMGSDIGNQAAYQAKIEERVRDVLEKQTVEKLKPPGRTAS